MASPEDFHDAIAAEKERNPNGWMVDAHDAADYANDLCLLTEDGKAGIAVTQDGDIVSLFSSVSGDHRMEKLMQMAIAAGGKKMDCFYLIEDGELTGLPNLYSRFGFKIASTTPFNAEYSPDGYAEWQKNNPNRKVVGVAAMYYDPTSRNQFDSYSRDHLPGFDKAREFTDRTNDKGETTYGYDLALEHRDNVLSDLAKNNADNDIFMEQTNGGEVSFSKKDNAYDYERYPLGKVEPFLSEKSTEIVKADINHGFKNIEAAKKWAKENIVKTYSEEETGGKGEIQISIGSVDKFLTESSTNKSDNLALHLATLKTLPTLLKTSIDVEIHPDFKKVNGERNVEYGYNSDVLVHRLYGAVEFGDNIYRVKITVRKNVRNTDTSKAHSYEATKIELLAGLIWESQEPSTRYSNNSIAMAKLLDGVEKSYDSGKKLLDESKTLSEGEISFSKKYGAESYKQPNASMLEPRRESVFDKAERMRSAGMRGNKLFLGVGI